MNNIKSYKLFESAPRIPKLNSRGLEYWKSKGKKGKDVMIYTHDDMDGIFSAIAVKSRLLDLGYNIIGYGILNYMDKWKYTSVDPEVINVAVDFAEMPKGEKEGMIDIYIDHHGEYTPEEKEKFKSNPVIKTHTGSAYEGICNVIGKPIDMITLYSIDMIDSAKYDDYHVDWRDIINFSWEYFIEISKKPGKVEVKPFKKSKGDLMGWPIIAKLTFAGAFNQLLKRGDHKTIIEVIDNVKEPSIYAIYLAMKKIYPGNNIWKKGKTEGDGKDFVDDGTWRMSQVKSRTRGDNAGMKPIYMTQKEYKRAGGGSEKGYKIIGDLMFIPSGTWANALRARSILAIDYDNGVIPKKHDVKFILLQYGNTLQAVTVKKIEEMDGLPILKNGSKLDNLGHYMESILDDFKKYFGYYDADTEIGQDELSVAGGHIGIGTISNIVGRVERKAIGSSQIRWKNLDKKQGLKLVDKYEGYKYLNLFKDKIIADLSGLNKSWPLGFGWSDESNNTISQMIRDIINNHPDYIKGMNRIANDFEFEGKTRAQAETAAKKLLKAELSELSEKEIRNLHQIAMTDHKVMMKKDIRQIDKEGNIPSRKEQELVSDSFISNFKNFNHILESYSYELPSNVEDFLSQFPDDATSWSQATDEMRDLARSIKEIYIEYDQELGVDDEGAYKPLNFKELKTPSDWNTKSKEYIRDTWSKMSDTSKEVWMKEWKHWFNGE